MATEHPDPSTVARLSLLTGVVMLLPLRMALTTNTWTEAGVCAVVTTLLLTVIAVFHYDLKAAAPVCQAAAAFTGAATLILALMPVINAPGDQFTVTLLIGLPAAAIACAVGHGMSKPQMAPALLALTVCGSLLLLLSHPINTSVNERRDRVAITERLASEGVPAYYPRFKGFRLDGLTARQTPEGPSYHLQYTSFTGASDSISLTVSPKRDEPCETCTAMDGYFLDGDAVLVEKDEFELSLIGMDADVAGPLLAATEAVTWTDLQ